MTKKRHAPDIWEQNWFIKLTITQQLFYLYISDKASDAGIWRPNEINFEQSRKVRIDLYKFLEAVNEDEIRISVLPNNIWFLNYHISTNHGSIYKSTNNWLNTALKTAFLSGVPIDWIKGFLNRELIDVESIKNSYIQRTTKYVLPQSPAEPLKPTIISSPEQKVNGEEVLQNSLEHRRVRVPGANPGFLMPEINYSFDGKPKDIRIEEWIQAHPFSYWIQGAGIRQASKVKCVIESFIKKIQATPRNRTVDEMGEYFNNWATKERIDNCAQEATDDPFDSIRTNYE